MSLLERCDAHAEWPRQLDDRIRQAGVAALEAPRPEPRFAPCPAGRPRDETALTFLKTIKHEESCGIQPLFVKAGDLSWRNLGKLTVQFRKITTESVHVLL